MYKKLFFGLAFLFSMTSVFAQLQSPEQFLGYKIGTRYTPHWRIVEYFKHVAAAMPSQMKLQPYGQTNEGRTLLVAYVSAAANIANLEKIRTTNIAIAATGAASNAATPVIVWFSYNVHGNETSSSEASMQTLFALLDPANTQTKTWLQNTVVIIDPCLNPDGRDRYVNWFNSVSGKAPNANLIAREHREPWPGGRTNHYNFDLNRDWAWQTQIETQQRMKVYLDWLPQIHVDFHEQSINSPYYFAPAAEPFHQVITPWQRRFQELIGRNHAKYFDAQGWLYYTKERFDLLYPSYGDTYPLYNGAIGMTYEQAGGSAGGTAALLQNGDTLTLADRVQHHYTTGLSTLEMASQNATKLVSEYAQFYKNARTNGIGTYKAFVIKNKPEDAERMDALKTLLQKNKIEFGYAKGGSVHGYDYENGNEQTQNISNADLVIPTTQQRGTLVDVLFEPATQLSDSVTYDITAWSLPYAYGLNAIASKSPVAFTTTTVSPPNASSVKASSYGYVIRWSGVQSAKLATQLLQKGIRLRYSLQPFQSGSETFDRGAVIILKTSNKAYPNLWDTVQQLANRFHVVLTPLSSGFVDKGFDFGSESIWTMQPRRVAVVTGEGISPLNAGEVWHFFDQVLDYPALMINAADLSRADWSQFDVLIMPDGTYRFLA
ncbi:MAG TPA: M14 metallopeptidase family protein, partial [Chitinophagaceae bacterium]|nr:M14 metallopeptidase family protein [Chitinophagaceae bacterium]